MSSFSKSILKLHGSIDWYEDNAIEQTIRVDVDYSYTGVNTALQQYVNNEILL